MCTKLGNCATKEEERLGWTRHARVREGFAGGGAGVRQKLGGV